MKRYAACTLLLHLLVQKFSERPATVSEVSGATYCLSVTTFPFPIQRALRIAEGSRLCMFEPENADKRSQDLEEAYHDAGQFCWGTASAFVEELPVYSEWTLPYLLPRHLVQDVDSTEDWEKAEAMFKVNQQAQTSEYRISS